jgi:predicted flap endonuclease-1-like 5' DNA nuclease
MRGNIQAIEGIGPKYAEALKGAGIANTAQLLAQGAQPQARRSLAERLDISEKLVLQWVNMSDLFRVKGIGGQYAELLEAAGVDTVRELRNRNAENLAAKMREVNDARRLVRQVPNLERVENWISQASRLEPAVFY